MKKIFTLFLAFVASVGIMFADAVQIGDLYYNLNTADQTAEVTYEDFDCSCNYENLQDVTIPSSITYNGLSYSVTSIGEHAFARCETLISVILPESVTHIGDYAFALCLNLESLTLNNNTTTAGENILGWEYYMMNIVIHVPCGSLETYSNAEGWSEYAQYMTHCIIERVQIGDLYYNLDATNRTAEMTYYPWTDEYTRQGYQIDSVVVPSQITYQSVVYNVVRIGDEAFYTGGSSGTINYVSSITLPSSIQSIGENAFQANCAECMLNPDNTRAKRLTSIYVPCGELSRFQQMVPEEERFKYFPSPYTIFKEGQGGGLVIVNPSQEDSLMDNPITICDKNVKVVAYPERGYRFVKWADGNTDNPRTIELKENVSVEAIFEIKRAGACGENLVWTLDEDSVLTISGSGAMEDYENIYKNSSAGAYGPPCEYNVPWHIPSVKTVILKNGVTHVGDHAFDMFRGYSFQGELYYESLCSITLPSSLTSIGEDAFKNRYNKPDIYVPCGELERFQQLIPEDNRVQ